MKNKILVVEDESKIREGIIDALTLNGFEVEGAERGDEALAKAIIQNPDIIILDIMLPKLNGFDVCENLRENGVTSHIIILSAKGREQDRIEGLEKGADDYITKPFSIKELIARVKAHLRRMNDANVGKLQQREASERVKLKNLTIDFEARACWSNEKRVFLSEKEFLILKFLLDNVGKVVQRDTLLREVWHYSDDMTETRTVDVTIGKMRQKIELDPSRPLIVKTRHGKGYIIEDYS